MSRAYGFTPFFLGAAKVIAAMSPQKIISAVKG